MNDENGKHANTSIKISLLAFLIFAAVGKAEAGAKTWHGGASGNPSDWNTAANWSPVGVPATGDNITIPGAITSYPILSAPVSNSVNNLTINSGASLTINSGGSLPVSGNPTVNGTLTISGGSLLASPGNLVLDGVMNLYGGTLAIHDFTGTGTATVSGGLLQVSHDMVGTGTTSMSGGTLQIGHDFKAVPAKFSAMGGTVEWTGSGGAGAFPAGTYQFFNVLIDPGVNPGFDNQANTIQVAGNWINNGSATLIRQTTTVMFNGASAQTLGGSSATTFTNLVINNGAGVTLSATAAVNGTFTLTSGILATGPNQIVLAAGGLVSGGSSGSYVNGTLQKGFPVGNGQTFLFPIGDAVNYTPVSLAGLNVTTAGSLAAKTVSGDHPSICGSGINPAKSVNRYWTITNAPGGIVVGSYNATFNFAPADVDAGANFSNFVSARYSGNWSTAAPGARTPVSTAVTGLAAFGDFAIGEPAGPQYFTSCCMGNDGSASLKLNGIAARTYTIQASTNLASWTNIGTATADANGVCQFKDVNAPNFSLRFYRAVYP